MIMTMTIATVLMCSQVRQNQMYLRINSLGFAAYNFSLSLIWRGQTNTVSAFGKTNRLLFRQIHDPLRKRSAANLFTSRNLQTRRNMGSSLSTGRKFNPKKNGFDNNPMALDEHGKFSFCTEYIEGVVCKENEIEENGMKVVDLGDEGGKVLLVKQKGKISALGTKCTHYGAPLVNGHLGDGRIRCQWHGACFNTSSGDIEDFPGLDSLPCYEVKISDGNVIVRADKELLAANKRVKPFTATINPKKATFVVVGGGPAGTICVETLRQQGFDGRIVFVMAEKYLPYDRIKLSKAMDIEVEKIFLRPLDFYQSRNIEIMQSTQLCGLNAQKKSACLSNGQTLNYDKIFLATGSTPRRLNVAGSELKNIFVLRTAEDARKIMEALNKSSRVVILGTSFIGMEVAAFCVDKVSSVTVIGRDTPFKPVFGSVIGSCIQKLFEEKNVNFCLNQSIEKFEGSDGKLTTIVLNNCTKIPADVCLVGIGSVSNTCYLNSSGISVRDNGTVEVNEYLQTSSPDVFAGGDIAYAPVLGQKASIGHWGLASYHGQMAAYNMLDLKKSLKAVPFFWTMLFGKGFRYAGYTQSFDDVVIDGVIEELKFIAYYCRGDNVVAVATANRDPLAAKFAEMLYENKELRKSEISQWVS